MRNGRVVAFLAVLAVVMWFFCHITPPTLADDVLYRCVWVDEASDAATRRMPIETFDDIVESQKVHYLTNNGRLVVHSVAQTVLAFVGEDVADVVNALMFCLLVWLCAAFATDTFAVRRRYGGSGGGGSGDMFFAVVVCAFLFFVVIPGFRDAFLWALGCFNYLWTAVAVMFFLIYFYRARERRFAASNLWMCLPALLVGWTHEGLTLPLSFGFAVWLLAERRRAVGSAAFPAVLCFFVGTALCVFSPGTMGRAGASEVTLATRVFLGVYNMVAFVRVLWVLLAVMAVAWWRDRRLLLNCLRRDYVLYAAAVPAYGIVMAVAQTEARVCFHAELLSTILLLNVIVRVRLVRIRRLVVACACAVMAAVTVALVPFALCNKRNHDRQMEQQTAPDVDVVRVDQLPRTGSKVFDSFVDKYILPSVVFGIYSCYQGFDADDCNLRCAAALYGKRRVMYLPREIAEKISDNAIALPADVTERNGSVRIPLSATVSDRRGDIAVVRLADPRPVRELLFRLKPENAADLTLRQRAVRYKGDTYIMPELKFKTVTMGTTTYLFFAWPTTNVRRRIECLEINYELEF